MGRAYALSFRGSTVGPDREHMHMEALVKVIAAAMFYGPFAYITAVGIHNTLKDRSTK